MVLSGCAIASGVAAQFPVRGYVFGERSTLPTGTTEFARLGAETAYVQGGALKLLREGRTLMTLPAGTTATFVERVSPGLLALGIRESGDIWIVPQSRLLRPQQVGSVPGHLDGTEYSESALLLTRGTAGGGGEVLLFSLTTGGVDPLIDLGSRPGPLHFGIHGLWVSALPAVDPAPPGSMRLGMFNRRTLLGGLGTNTLTLADANLSRAGFDPALDLVGDGDFDAIVVREGDRAIYEISFDLETTGFSFLGVQQLIPPPNSGGGRRLDWAGEEPVLFEPFAENPEHRLWVLWERPTSPRVAGIQTAPATASVPETVAPGPFQIGLRNGPVRGTGILMLWFGPFFPISQNIPGFDQNLVLPALLPSAAAVYLPFSLDAFGEATVPYLHPGGIPPGVTLYAQPVFVNQAGNVLGTTRVDSTILL